MSDWQPIETARKYGRHFLATGLTTPPGGIVAPTWWVGVGRYDGDFPRLENTQIPRTAITHWMPLPGPPKT